MARDKVVTKVAPTKNIPSKECTVRASEYPLLRISVAQNIHSSDVHIPKNVCSSVYPIAQNIRYIE
jgi:hypothetical protein